MAGRARLRAVEPAQSHGRRRSARAGIERAGPRGCWNCGESGAGAAASKFATLRRWTDENGEPRIRYAYRYHGASSGRFTSLGVQLHNLRKPELEDVARRHRRGRHRLAGGNAPARIRAPARDRRPDRARDHHRAAPASGCSSPTCPASRRAARPMSAALPPSSSNGGCSIAAAGRKMSPTTSTGISTFRQPPATARKAGKTGALAFQYQGGVGAYRRITGDDDDSATRPSQQRRDAWRADHPEYTRVLAAGGVPGGAGHPSPRTWNSRAKAVAFQYDLNAPASLKLTLPSGRRLTYPAAELFEDEQYGQHQLHLPRRLRQQDRPHVPRTPRQRRIRRLAAGEYHAGAVPGHVRRGDAATRGRPAIRS